MIKRLTIRTGPALLGVYKEERILFVDKEEDIETDDRSVEKRILDEIGRSL
ncbi:MAG: hypothetical protein WEG40_11020 [Candidatus Rokuibacteriota bacterium]